MDKAKKNTVIHAAADRMAANYKSSQIPMYGDALRMPNRNAVIEIIRDCQKLIFPVYYGDRDLLKLPPEQYSALLMEHIHEKLTRQITLTKPECDENCEVAYAISTAFIERIPAIQELLLKDLSANFEGDPAAYSKEEVLLSYPGMFAIFIYRIAHELYENKVAMIPRMMSEYAHSQTGIDINPGAKIGEYFFIDHGTGVVVGETTIIGDNVKLYQGATLGALLGFSTTNGEAFGIFAGTAINDTSSVTAAASTWDSLYGLGSQTLDKAVTVKLTRTLAIIPTVLVFAAISVHLKKKAAAQSDGHGVKVNMKSVFPWFILGFLAMSILCSVGVIPAGLAATLKSISKFLMVAALAAIGLNTNFAALCKSGAKPMLHGFIISLLVVLVAIAVEYVLGIAPSGTLI